MVKYAPRSTVTNLCRRNRSRRAFSVVNSATITTFDFGDNDADKNKKTNPKNHKILKRIEKLNKLFYQDTHITVNELDHLIVSTFSQSVQICLKYMNNQMYIVIFPEVVTPNEIYRHSLSRLVHVLTEWGVRDSVFDFFETYKNGGNTSSTKKLLIPLDIYYNIE